MGGTVRQGGERSQLLPAALTTEPACRPMRELINDLHFDVH
jgi:hypothetical protein